VQAVDFTAAQNFGERQEEAEKSSLIPQRNLGPAPSYFVAFEPGRHNSGVRRSMPDACAFKVSSFLLSTEWNVLRIRVNIAASQTEHKPDILLAISGCTAAS
jgi:hypothetical protein